MNVPKRLLGTSILAMGMIVSQAVAAADDGAKGTFSRYMGFSTPVAQQGVPSKSGDCGTLQASGLRQCDSQGDRCGLL